MLAPVRIRDHFPVAPDKQLELVVVAVNRRVAGLTPWYYELNHVFTLETGYKHSDFEYYEFDLVFSSDAGYTFGVARFDADTVIVGENLYFRNQAGTSASDVNVSVTSESSMTITSVSGDTRIAGVKAFKNRHVTEIKQVIIPVTPDYVSSGTFVNTDEVTVNQRYTIDANKLPSDFRNADGTINDSVKCVAEIYNNSGTGVADWGETGSYTDFTSQVFASFVKAGKAGNSIAVQTGATSLCERSKYGGSAFGNTNIINAAPCRLIVWNDEKYSTSIPVSDKGYGGLVKTTLATAIADFTVPTVINFDAVAVTTPLKVVQNVVDNRLSLNQIGMWETTGNLELGFDTAVGDRKIKVELWNETLGELAAETTRYVARNQSGDSIPFTIGLVEVLNAGHEYSLRIYSADSFSNVVVNKCRWDVKLYSPL